MAMNKTKLYIWNLDLEPPRRPVLFHEKARRDGSYD